MSTYFVDVHHMVHRCPANPDKPHVIQTTRQIVATIDGGPCLKPIKVQGQDTPCGRIATAENQCAACRANIIIHQTSVTDLGYQGAASEMAASLLDHLPAKETL